jgi:dGTPase
MPAEAISILGASGTERIDALVHDMVEHSRSTEDIGQGADAERAMLALREFMFDRVYLGREVTSERARIEGVLRRLFEHYAAQPELLGLPRASGPPSEAELAQAVTDYLAGMTDRFCIAAFTELEVPRAFAR